MNVEDFDRFRRDPIENLVWVADEGSHPNAWPLKHTPCAFRTA